MLSSQIVEFLSKCTQNKLINKLVIATVAAFVFLWLVLAVLLSFVNVDALAGRSLIPLSYSAYSVQYFVIPKIILQDVRFGSLEVKEAKVTVDKLSLLKFRPAIGSLDLEGATLYDNLGNLSDVLNHRKFLSELDKNMPALKLYFKGLSLNVFGRPLYFDTLKIHNTDSSFVLNGNTNGGINISSKLSKGSNFKLIVKSVHHNFSLVEDYNNNTGKLDFETDNIASIFNPTHSHQAKTKITANIIFENNIMRINDIVMTGESISGGAKFAISDTAINLDANLQDVFVSDFVDAQDIKDGFISSQVDRLIPDTMQDIGIHVKAANIRINNQKIQNINFDFQTDPNKVFVVNDFSGAFDDVGGFKINGKLIQDQHHTKFDGNAALTHGDFNKLLANLDVARIPDVETKIPISWSSILDITSISFGLENIECKIGDSDVKGAISFNTVGDDVRLNGVIKVSHFDTNSNIVLIKDSLKYFNSLVFDSYHPEYVDKFVPLRANNLIMNINLGFDDLKVGNKHFDKINLLVNTSPAKLLLNSFTVLNQDMYLSGNASLDASNFQPMYKIDVLEGVLPSVGASNILDLKNFLQKDINLANIAIEVSAKLKNFTAMNVPLQNFSIVMRDNNSSLLIDKISFDAFGGNAFLNGSISVKPFLVNVGYAYNNIDLEPVFNQSIILAGTKGVISTSGSFNFTGDQLNEMLYSLNVKGNVIGKNVIIPNLGVDDLVSRITHKDYQNINLPNDLVFLANNGTTNLISLRSGYTLGNGVFKFKDMSCATDKTTAVISAALDIYKQDMNLVGLFNFYSDKELKTISQVKLDVSDNIFNPQKTLQLRQNLSSDNLQK